MAQPHALIFSGYGLNCEEETAHAFRLAGGDATIIHINDLIAKPSLLKKFQIAAFPGGFSYGDDTGSGNAYANKVRHHLWKELKQFVTEDRLVIGICNGFQILTNLGLVPAIDNAWGERQVALVHNDSARYSVRWVDLEVTSTTPWLYGLSQISVPIAHGEGKVHMADDILKKLKANNQVALCYVKGEMCDYQSLPTNPNGSIANIAGLTDPSGRVLGLMPHPERALFFTQMPNWPVKYQLLLRNAESAPEHGPGLAIFRNAVNYFA